MSKRVSNERLEYLEKCAQLVLDLYYARIAGNVPRVKALLSEADSLARSTRTNDNV